jgi:hypothetical protein
VKVADLARKGKAAVAVRAVKVAAIGIAINIATAIADAAAAAANRAPNFNRKVKVSRSNEPAAVKVSAHNAKGNFEAAVRAAIVRATVNAEINSRVAAVNNAKVAAAIAINAVAADRIVDAINVATAAAVTDNAVKAAAKASARPLRWWPLEMRVSAQRSPVFSKNYSAANRIRVADYSVH